MICIHLDFETRSECDLKACGHYRYAEDPTTEILCMAYAIDDGPVGLWIPGNGALPKAFQAALDAGAILLAHNAGFERQIWAKIAVLRHNWPKVPPERWRCTAARCAALALPRSLDGAATALGLDHEKDMDGHRLMLKMSKPLPKSQRKNRGGQWAERPEEFDRLYEYCRKDVEVERAVYGRTGPLNMSQVSEWHIDQEINDLGVPIDLSTVAAAIKLDDAEKKKLNLELAGITGYQVTAGTERKRILDWLIDRGVNLGDLQAETVRTMLADEDAEYEPDVRRVLELRQLLSLSSTAKYRAMERMACADGRVRGVHMYHGASTGRWAGMGVQFQNVPRGDMDQKEVAEAIAAINNGSADMFYDDIPKMLSSCLRAMIRAPKGRKLIVCDFSGIEARVLAWLAGETRLISEFRRGDDVYVNLAAEIYNIDKEDVTKEQRFMGKTAVLGLGYQMGPNTFIASVEKYGSEITEEFSQKVVNTFRNVNPKIPQLWSVLDAKFREVTCSEKKDEVGIVKRVEIKWNGAFVQITLPSKRMLSFYRPKVIPRDGRQSITYMGVNGYTRAWERLTTYGGSIAESIVQAISRDLLFSAMCRLDVAGYETIFHVHDEVVIECDEDFGSLKEVEEIMCRSPDWARGLPVGAEGFEAERYRK